MNWIALAIVAIGTALFINAQYRNGHPVIDALLSFGAGVVILFGLLLFALYLLL